MNTPATKTILVQIPKYDSLGNRTGSYYRDVVIPADTLQKDLLDTVFHYGQNDVQPLPCPSVSVGHIIHNPVEDALFLVAPVGFRRISDRLYSVWTYMNPAEVERFAYTGRADMSDN